MERFDYVTVSQKLWNHLFSWYQADYTISRMVRRDQITKIKVIELYPGKLIDNLL